MLRTRAFGAKHADESHRARLRVEIGRLRRLLQAVARVSATKQGFALSPRGAREVVVLARPVEERHAAVVASLADGESWSGSALALALGASQRTVQRALKELSAAGKVQAFGRGRARRWMIKPWKPPVASVARRRRIGARIQWQRSFLLRRRKQRKGESRPPAQAKLSAAKPMK